MKGIKTMLFGIALLLVSIAFSRVLSSFLEYTVSAIGLCFVIVGCFQKN